jgi:hypothetical protein
MRAISIILVVLILIGGFWVFRPSQKALPLVPAGESPTTDTDATGPVAPQPDMPNSTTDAPTTLDASRTGPTTAPAHNAARSSSTDPAHTTARPDAPTSTTSGAARPGDPSLTTRAPLPAMPPAGTCFVREYRHKASARTLPIDEFLEHLNAFPLEHPDANPKSICVRVNGNPVDFAISSRGPKKEIVLGPVVGPESVIRISYCTKTARCTEACAKPRRRFMDELTGDALAGIPAGELRGAGGRSTQDAGSRASPSDADSRELRAGLKELQSLARQNDSLTDRAILRDWNQLVARERSCKEN